MKKENSTLHTWPTTSQVWKSLNMAPLSSHKDELCRCPVFLGDSWFFEAQSAGQRSWASGGQGMLSDYYNTGHTLVWERQMGHGAVSNDSPRSKSESEPGFSVYRADADPAWWQMLQDWEQVQRPSTALTPLSNINKLGWVKTWLNLQRSEIGGGESTGW